MEHRNDAVTLAEEFFKSISKINWIDRKTDFEAEPPKGKRVAIEDWQQSLIQMRIDSLQTPGIYLDASPTGAGKSTADQEALRVAKKGLIVLPTHKQCEELEDELTDRGFHAVAYRGRFTKGEKENCWNDDADEAEEMGLSVAAAVCLCCEHRTKCLASGYLAETAAAREAPVAIATHARAIHRGLESLATDRPYLAVHEDVLKVLLQEMHLTPKSLGVASAMLEELLNNPKWLNHFGNAETIDSDGHRVSDDRKGARNDHIYQYLRRMADLVDELITTVKDASATHQLTLPVPCQIPAGIERVLFRISRECKAIVGGLTPWPTLLSIISGRATRLAVVVQRSKGKLTKCLMAVRVNVPPPEITTWLADATADAELVELAIGHHVKDCTPDGHLEMVRKVEQHAVDITGQTSSVRVRNLIRGILADHPNYRRVGVICHSSHVADIETLGDPFDCRICRVAYFWSGEDRALNSWHKECDLLIVMGTPRLRPDVIRSWLVRIGLYEAARRDGDWGRLRWKGSTRNGQCRNVDGLGYRDSDWQRAHRANVRANIVQAVGRSRAFRESGCDAVLLSSEESGFSLCSSAETVQELTEPEALILRTLIGARSYNTLIGTSADKRTNQIAAAIGLRPRQTRELLNHLRTRDLVQRPGQRGNWALSERGARLAPDEDDESTSKQAIRKE